MSRPPDEAGALPGVELRHLAAIVAVADIGSFRGAAARLGYAQSAISQLIATLESRAGHPLIERSRGPGAITLTPAGQLVVAHARSVVARIQAARADLEALDAASPAALRIGIDPNIVKGVLPPTLAALKRAQPDQRVVPVEVSDEHSRQMLLAAGELDAAFGDLPVTAGQLESVSLLVDPYVLVVPADAPVAALEREVTLADLDGLQLLGPASELLAGRVPGRAGSAPTDATLQSLVAAGLGAAVVSRLALERQLDVVALGVGDLIAPRVLALSWHRDRRDVEAIAALRAAARQALGRPRPLP